MYRSLEYGHHLGQLHCRAHAPASNTAGHDNHEKINSSVSFSFLYEYGALLNGPIPEPRKTQRNRKIFRHVSHVGRKNWLCGNFNMRHWFSACFIAEPYFTGDEYTLDLKIANYLLFTIY